MNCFYVRDSRCLCSQPLHSVIPSANANPSCRVLTHFVFHYLASFLVDSQGRVKALHTSTVVESSLAGLYLLSAFLKPEPQTRRLARNQRQLARS